jgi:predicted  nucleic acid-binding Zn-ribbon protein
MSPRERTHRNVPTGGGSPAKYARDEIIIIQLGDLIDRLPAPLLIPGEHDLSQPITFEITEVAKQIAEGRPNIELSEIYRKLPGIFCGPIKASDGLRVRFPWQRLVEMLRAADTAAPSDGLTRAAALQLARILRGQRSSFADRTFGKIAASAAALARAPQWFTRNLDNADNAPDGERILHELAASLEQFAPAESNDSRPSSDRIGSSDALAIATEENTRLRREIDEKDGEIESLRKMLAELESAAIDQIAALNQQCEEYEAAKTKHHNHEEKPLNPQQTAIIESLSHQVAELYKEVDRAREDALQATAAHAKYREQQGPSSAAAADMEQYLASVAYELERANAVLKEMEAKVNQAEKLAVAKDEEIQRLTDEYTSLKRELADARVERDALRGRLYKTSPGEPAKKERLPSRGTEG